MCSSNNAFAKERAIVSIPLLTLTAVFGILFYIFRMFIKGAQFKEKVSATGKVAFVTNATTPLGMQTALELNKFGASVYLLCRNAERGEEARRWINNHGGDLRRLFVKTVNLRDMQAIRNFTKDLSNDLEVIDILVVNTDAIIETNLDSIQREVRMGNLGHFLLVELLLPKLEKSFEGRVVVVSSQVLDPDRLDEPKKNEPMCFRSYRKSLKANAVYARMMTQRIREANPSSAVTVNACYPGTVFDNLVRSILPGQVWLRELVAPFLKIVTKSLEDGVQTTLYLALSRSVEQTSGKYFEECGLKSLSRGLLDDSKSEQLFTATREALKLQ